MSEFCGSRTGYNKGCRCEGCRQANNSYVKARRSAPPKVLPMPEERPDVENTLRSLELAVKAIERNKESWQFWSPRYNRTKGTPYYWASLGWEANNHEGPYRDILDVLRQHVPDGDLTWWWHHGQYRRDMLDLFQNAVRTVQSQERAAA
jgi:hypothetical protein